MLIINSVSNSICFTILAFRHTGRLKMLKAEYREGNYSDSSLDFILTDSKCHESMSKSFIFLPVNELSNAHLAL